MRSSGTRGLGGSCLCLTFWRLVAICSDKGASNADLAPEASNLIRQIVQLEYLQATVAAMVTPIVKKVMDTGGTASSAAAGGGGKWNIRQKILFNAPKLSWDDVPANLANPSGQERIMT